MPNPRLLLLGQDLIDLDLVTDTPNINERKTFKRDKLISNDFDFKCMNRDFIFSTGNAASIFSGSDWFFAPVQYYNEDDILIWDGVLTNVRNNYRTMTTTLETKDKLYQYRENYIEYESSTWETPADAAKNILDAYDFTNYDVTSFQNSINHLTDNSIYVDCNFNLSDNLNIYNALEKLAVVAGADCYSSLGNVFFKVWQPYTGGASVSLNVNKDTRLRSDCIMNFLENEIINDYAIDYDGSGGTPVEDSSGGNNIGASSRGKYGTRSLEPMQTGTGKQIVVQNIDTAIWIGEQYLYRTHANLLTDPRPLISIQFDISAKFKEYITLDSYFQLTYPFESWTNKVFEVYEFRRNRDKQNINILAYEAVT